MDCHWPLVRRQQSGRRRMGTAPPTGSPNRCRQGLQSEDGVVLFLVDHLACHHHRGRHLWASPNFCRRRSIEGCARRRATEGAGRRRTACALKHLADVPYLPMPDRSRLPWWLHVPPLRRRCRSRRRGTAFWLPRSGTRQKKIAGMDPSRAGKEAAGRLGAEARREDMRGESDGIRIANSLGEVWGSCWTFFFFQFSP